MWLDPVLYYLDSTDRNSDLLDTSIGKFLDPVPEETDNRDPLDTCSRRFPYPEPAARNNAPTLNMYMYMYQRLVSGTVDSTSLWGRCIRMSLHLESAAEDNT